MPDPTASPSEGAAAPGPPGTDRPALGQAAAGGVAEATERRLLERLRRAYLLALSLVAVAIAVEYFVAEGTRESQRGDAEVINVAGRQRMLSQRIVKLSLLRAADSVWAADSLRATDSVWAADSPRVATAVAPLLVEWRERHEWLRRQTADGPGAEALDALTPAVDSVTALAMTRPTDPAELQRLDALGDDFLRRMDAAVGLLSASSEEKVEDARRAGLWLVLAALAILGLEVAFIFRPLLRFTAAQLQQVRERRAAETAARDRAEAAYLAKDASLRELNALTSAIEQAALFATLRHDGTVVQLSRKLRRLLGLDAPAAGRHLPELLHPDPVRRAALAGVLAEARATEWQGEVEVVDADGETRYLQLTLVPARRMGLDTELFALASDVTEQRETRGALDALNAARLAEEVERGRTRSRQILEVQEKERLRVARDLHDGIGQQLTALKFGLEGLRFGEEGSREAERLEQLRGLCKDLIRGVRMATFNLSPPELDDYGLAPALEKMARELSRLTGERIVFRVEGPPPPRLPSTTEVNLYRVTQEAVNNAIKYARANYILVTLSAGERLLSISVDDDGDGFDAAGFDAADAHAPGDGTGLGLSFMRERVADLGGRLFVRSEAGGGTRVTINAPIEP